MSTVGRCLTKKMCETNSTRAPAVTLSIDIPMCLAELRPKMQHIFCGAPPFIQSIEFKPMIQDIYIHLHLGIELFWQIRGLNLHIIYTVYAYVNVEVYFPLIEKIPAVEAEIISYIYISEGSYGHKTIQNPTILSILDLYQDFKTTVLQLVMTQVQHLSGTGIHSNGNLVKCCCRWFCCGKKVFFWKNMFQNMVWFSSIVLQNPLLRGGRKRPCLISFHDRFIAPPKEWVVWLSITHGLRGLVGGIVQPKKMKTRSLERSWKQINVSTPFWIVSCEYMILESEQGSK